VDDAAPLQPASTTLRRSARSWQSDLANTWDEARVLDPSPNTKRLSELLLLACLFDVVQGASPPNDLLCHKFLPCIERDILYAEADVLARRPGRSLRHALLTSI
jgi:hypothetical protein